jgi:hypothetical protein
MFNPYAYSFHEGLYRTYGKVTRIYSFLGVSSTSKDLLPVPAGPPFSHFYHWEQDIQLVISDPTAFNNIVKDQPKNQPIFELTEPFLRYVSPLE